MTPHVSSRRAVLCADGRIHYSSEYLTGGLDTESIRLIADSHRDQSYCGGAPHWVGEQTTTVSDWKPVTA